MRRWNLVIPEKTDRAVRTFLARTGGRKGDLSRFVDEAVRRRVLDLTVREIKDRNARYDQQEIIDLIDEEVAAARADRP
jgi:Ribbon-helix-helix domain